MRRFFAVGLIAAILAVGIFASNQDARAASDISCSAQTTDGQQGGYFLAIALTNCAAPPNQVVDTLNLVVFWQYCNWNGPRCIWTDGGDSVYDMNGCTSCLQVFSRTSHKVPLGYYFGINCRAAETVHLIWPSITNQQSRFYFTTRSAGQCH